MISNKMLTAEEFTIQYNSCEQKDSLMVAFAKYHAEAALKEASKKARVYGENAWTLKEITDGVINSYPLTKIK